MKKIIRLSTPLMYLCRTLIILLPLVLIVFWTVATPIEQDPGPLFHAGTTHIGASMSFAPHLPAMGNPALGLQFAPMVSIQKLVAWQRISAGSLSLLELSFTILILFYLSQLFHWYSQGNIFSTEHVRCFKNIAVTLIAAQICRPLLDGAMCLILTWYNHPGRMISISFSNANVMALLSGVIILLIALIMQEGYKLNQEMQLTV